MRRGLIINSIFIIFFFFSSAVAWAVFLDFESGCGSNPAPAGCKEIISTSGFSTDVMFGQSSRGTDMVSQLGAPALPFSPSRSARWDPDQTLPDDPFRADFIIAGVNLVSVVLGDNGQDADNLFLTAFDQDGNVLGSDAKTLSANTRGGFVLSVNAPDIAFVEFGRMIGQAREGNSVQFDNFTYKTMNATVPEPSALLMIGTGLLCLGFWRIRQNKRIS